MKKEWFRVWFLYYLGSWFLCFGVHYLHNKSVGHDLHLLEISITAAILAIFVSFLPIFDLFPIIPRHNKYLKNNDIKKPSFIFSHSSMVETLKKIDFSRLKAEISDKWVITFADEEGKVLKFRDKISFFKLRGTGAWLKYDNEAGKLHIECFLIAGMRHDLSRKMQKEIEKCLKLSELILPN